MRQGQDEIEVKVLEIDKNQVTSKLKKLGAEKIFEGELHMINYDFPNEELEGEDSFLRVRKVGDEVELTFKGKRKCDEIKVREEIEVNTNNFKDTCKILERVGLEKFYEGKKHRTSYKIKDVRFEIDKYKDLPTYLEIEAPTRKEVKKYVQKLGYSMDETTTKTAYELRHE